MNFQISDYNIEEILSEPLAAIGRGSLPASAYPPVSMTGAPHSGIDSKAARRSVRQPRCVCECVCVLSGALLVVSASMHVFVGVSFACLCLYPPVSMTGVPHSGMDSKAARRSVRQPRCLCVCVLVCVLSSVLLVVFASMRVCLVVRFACRCLYPPVSMTGVPHSGMDSKAARRSVRQPRCVCACVCAVKCIIGGVCEHACVFSGALFLPLCTCMY